MVGSLSLNLNLKSSMISAFLSKSTLFEIGNFNNFKGVFKPIERFNQRELSFKSVKARNAFSNSVDSGLIVVNIFFRVKYCFFLLKNMNSLFDSASLSPNIVVKKKLSPAEKVFKAPHAFFLLFSRTIKFVYELSYKVVKIF
jgi:hypothetical protein